MREYNRIDSKNSLRTESYSIDRFLKKSSLRHDAMQKHLFVSAAGAPVARSDATRAGTSVVAVAIALCTGCLAHHSSLIIVHVQGIRSSCMRWQSGRRQGPLLEAFGPGGSQ